MDEKKRARLMAAITPQGSVSSPPSPHEITRLTTPVTDWAYWPARREVEIWEAVALSLNIDPGSLEFSPLGAIRNFSRSGDSGKFTKRLKMTAALTQHTERLPLSQYATMLGALPMPPEMAATVTLPAPDGNVDQTATTVLRADLDAWMTAKAAPPVPVVTPAVTPRDAPVDTTGMVAVLESPPVVATSHKLKTRRNVLDAVIEQAKKSAISPSDYHSVWAALVSLAESKDRPAPLLGYVEEDGVKYQGSGKVEFFKKDSLRKRMTPSAR